MTRGRTLPRHPVSIRRTGVFVAKTAGLVLVAWLFVWPLVMLILGAFRSSPLAKTQTWSLKGVTRVFQDGATYGTLGVTFVYALVITAVAMAFAVFFATVNTRLDVPLRRLITPMMVILSVLPTMLYSLGWAMLGAGDSGLVDKLFTAVGLPGLAEWFDMRSWTGLVLVTAFKAGALGYLIIIGAFRQRSAAMEEAARVSGASVRRAFFGIELPMLAPALIAASLFLFIKGIEAFDTPAVLGTPAGIQVYSTHLYEYLRGGLRPDYAAASAGSLLVALILGVLVTLQWKAGSGGRSFVTVGARGSVARLRRPGRAATTVVTALIVLAIVATIVLPVTQIVAAAFTPYLGASNFTLAHFQEIFSSSAGWSAIWNTMQVSIFGGIAAVALAVTVAYSFSRSRSGASRFIQAASWVPAGMPGLVLGLAFLWSFLTTPGGRTFYGTIWMLVAGLAVASVPLATRTIEGPLAQIGKDLEEAARISGAGFGRAFAGVTVRLLTPSLLAAWLLVAINISGILDLPLLLGSTDTQMISTVSFTLYENGRTGGSAALYLVFIVLMAGAAALLALLSAAVRGLLDRRTARAPAASAENPRSRSETASGKESQ
ncbi:ABC transporter permease [Nonomuraea wenchangensis]|uniref:ABC transporter permease n=2 Tax=Nonomuraea wenchangensis TaxID=568860 RepID=UPI003322AFDC